MRFRVSKLFGAGVVCLLCWVAASAQPSQPYAPDDGALLRIALRQANGETGAFILRAIRRDGEPVSAADLHSRLLASGVHEITIAGRKLRQWEIAIDDQSAFYGFGERLSPPDRMPKAVLGASTSEGNTESRGNFRFIPFFVSTRGYGVWIDTNSAAGFDLNAASPVARPRLVIRAEDRRLRMVVIEGPSLPEVLDRFAAIECARCRDTGSHERRTLLQPASSVMADGKPVAARESKRGEPIRFDPEGRVRIAWLKGAMPQNPATPSTPMARFETPAWSERYQAKLDEARKHRADLVFLGDSITERWESGAYRELWNYYTQDRNALNLGISGDTTGNLLWRITEGGELNGLHPKCVVLLIGTNNTSEKHPDWTADQTVAGIEKIVAELRDRLPATRIIVIGVLPSNRSPEKDRLDDAINQQLADTYRTGRAGNVDYIDVSAAFLEHGRIRTCLFADPRFVPPAGAVHPTVLGQSLLAAAIEPLVSKDLGVRPKTPFAVRDDACHLPPPL